MKILIVASHPDDEVLGVGGTISRLVEEGNEAVTLILGRGIESRYDHPDQADTSLIDEHRGNSRRANEILGIKTVHFRDFADNRMDGVDLLDVVKAVEAVVSDYGPEWIFTQHGGDLNVDHLQTYRAVLAATRPMQGTSVRRVYSYEVMSSTEWAFHKFEPKFTPDTFFDINGYLDRKIAAMQCYEFESRPFPHPRSPEAIRAYALRWGSTAGLLAAEAFQTVRAIY